MKNVFSEVGVGFMIAGAVLALVGTETKRPLSSAG